MKANARHVLGSTRSSRAPLSRSFPFFLPSLLSLKNPSKIRPKSDHFHRYEFFNGYIQTTYNFDPLKRSDFPGALGLLAADNQRLATESHDARLKRADACCPFSPGEKARMRDRPVHPVRSSAGANKHTNTVQNGIKRDEFHISKKRTAPYQPLTTIAPPVVPFCIQQQLLAMKPTTAKPNNDGRRFSFPFGEKVGMRDRPVSLLHVRFTSKSNKIE